MAVKRDDKAPQYRKIHIIAAPNSDLKVIDPFALLEKSNLEEAEWVIHPEGTPFKVIFDKNGTPFDGRVTFTETDNISGPITVSVPLGQVIVYYYRVEVEGFPPLDPGIIIR